MTVDEMDEMVGTVVWRLVKGALAALLFCAALFGAMVWLTFHFDLQPEPPAKGRPYTAETWDRLGPGPARKAEAPRPRKADPEPATVREARRESACQGPACYRGLD